MIENEKQYRVTRHSATKFRKTLIALYNLQVQQSYSGLRSAEIAGIESQLAEFNEQIKAWEDKQAK